MHKMEQLSDQQLMREIVSDNFKAFTELYNRYKHTLFQFVIRLSHGDYSMAEEVVQETFIIIWIRSRIAAAVTELQRTAAAVLTARF